MRWCGAPPRRWAPGSTRLRARPHSSPPLYLRKNPWVLALLAGSTPSPSPSPARYRAPSAPRVMTPCWPRSLAAHLPARLEFDAWVFFIFLPIFDGRRPLGAPGSPESHSRCRTSPVFSRCDVRPVSPTTSYLPSFPSCEYVPAVRPMFFW